MFIKRIQRFSYYSEVLKETEEYFDSTQEVRRKTREIVKLLKNSQYPILLTGAGVSTNSGIPDYRSSYQTKVPTGPGRWETKENKEIYYQQYSQPQTVQALNAIPSYSHLAIASLMENQYFKHLITQNVDNLHRKAGVKKEQITELHGNINIERCDQCLKEFYRDYYVRPSHLPHSNDHFNGRYCDGYKCTGQLLDTLVFFGEPLHIPTKELAYKISEEADFCLVVGTSLKVNPAQRLPFYLTKRNKPIASVNLQKTALERYFQVKINTFTNDFFEILCDELDVKVNKNYSLKRKVTIQLNRLSDDEFQISIFGQDWEGQLQDNIKSVAIEYVYDGKNEKINLNQKQEGQSSSNLLSELKIHSITKIEIFFYSNQNEPNLIIDDKKYLNQFLEKTYESKGNYTELELNLENNQWKLDFN